MILYRISLIHYPFLISCVFAGALSLSGVGYAQSTEGAQQTESGLWGRAQTLADDVWSTTRDLAEETWTHTRGLFSGSQEENSFARVWEGIVPRLEEALALEDQHETLPEEAWFGRDQADNRDDINALLDQAIGILSISPSQRYRVRIRELEEAIRKAQEDIAEYRKQRVAAPQDALLEKTAAEYDEAIREREALIAEYRNELQTLKSEFARELQQQGLKITDEQLDFMLSTVIGDDLIEMGIAFDNVKNLTGQLEQLMVESREDLNSARRYYGMYVVLLQVLDRMHKQVIDAIDKRYLAEIDTIMNKTRALLKETYELQQRVPASLQTLSANIQAQELTLRTAGFYRDYLVDQSREVARARESLAEDIAIAENTYETVKVSGELVALMKSSQRLLDTLINRQVPALRTFENLEMRREFEKLTAQLREGVAS